MYSMLQTEYTRSSICIIHVREAYQKFGTKEYFIKPAVIVLIALKNKCGKIANYDCDKQYH